MKKISKVIVNCHACPHFEVTQSTFGFCRKEHNSYTIVGIVYTPTDMLFPSFCPLPNAEGEKDEYAKKLDGSPTK